MTSVTKQENRHVCNFVRYVPIKLMYIRDKRVEFVSDRVSYIVLRGRWCNIIFLNVHAPSEDKSDDSKDSF